MYLKSYFRNNYLKGELLKEKNVTWKENYLKEKKGYLKGESFKVKNVT